MAASPHPMPVSNGRFPTQEAIEKIHFAVDEVQQGLENGAVGAGHSGVQGMLIEALAEC